MLLKIHNTSKVVNHSESPRCTMDMLTLNLKTKIQDGVKKYSTEIVAQEMKMLDSKTNSSGSSIGAGIDISKPPF